MRKIKFISIWLLIIFGLSAGAQNSSFITQGKIEYERKTNLQDQLKDWDWDDGSWSEVMKKAIPKFKISYYDLSFSDNITLFKPGKENPDNDKIPGWFGDFPGEANTIYTNLEADQSTSQKKVYEMTYLLQDSTRKIKWKITDETRTIAGFQCRRANAIVMDSIYVVAFYTDEILTRGGPESFSGLPE